MRRGAPGWLGTTVRFERHALDDETARVFSHAGSAAPVESMHHFSTKWAAATRAQGRPEGRDIGTVPQDAHISGWGSMGDVFKALAILTVARCSTASTIAGARPWASCAKAST